MKKALAALALLLPLALPVNAQEIWTTAMIRSYHSDRSAHFNEQNTGFGFEYKAKDEDQKVVAGAYNNSYNRLSIYAGKAWLPWSHGNWSAGAIYGLVSGYPRYKYNLGLLGLGVLQYENGKYGANILVVPPVPDPSGDKPTAVVALQLKMSYD